MRCKRPGYSVPPFRAGILFKPINKANVNGAVVWRGGGGGGGGGLLGCIAVLGYYVVYRSLYTTVLFCSLHSIIKQCDPKVAATL